MIEITKLPRFFETKCNFCGARLRYHVEDLKGSLQFSCPNCGWLVEHEVGNAVFEKDEKDEKAENEEEEEEKEKDDATAEESTEKTVPAASLGYMNTPASLSDEEWKLICDSFSRTTKEAEAIGTAFFSCPVYLSCKKCPLKGYCQKVTYSAEVWKKLEKQWKAQYEYNEEEKCYE